MPGGEERREETRGMDVLGPHFPLPALALLPPHSFLRFFFFGSFLKSLLNFTPRSGIKPVLHCTGRWSLGHWTTKEVPPTSFLRKGLEISASNSSHPNWKSSIPREHHSEVTQNKWTPISDAPIVVQSLSCVQLFAIPWTCKAGHTPLSSTISWSLLTFTSIELVMPTISSSVSPFSSCLQSFPASVSFPMNQFFTSGDQNTGVSALTSVLPMNIQD